MIAVNLIFTFLLATTALAVPKLSRKPSFEIKGDWALVPDVTGRLHMMHKSEILLSEEALRWNAEENVFFNLHTPSNPGGSNVILDNSASLFNAGFNPNVPTRITIHGWNGDITSGVNTDVRNAYFMLGHFNVIVVDWSNGAGTLNYIDARNRVNDVGPLVGRFVDFIVQNGASLSNIYLIGHSLGGHTVGIAGKNVQSGKVNTIIALDPAGPLFDVDDRTQRVDADDAHYVEIIHTNGWLLGMGAQIGQADFYPNGGKSQPGCGILDIVGTCAHGRSWEFFAESITTSVGFWASQCSGTVDDVSNERCAATGKRNLMGGEPSNQGTAWGLYYLTTSSESPYAQGFV